MREYLTASEIAARFGMDKQDVIRMCVDHPIPIFHGKISATHFELALRAASSDRRQTQ